MLYFFIFQPILSFSLSFSLFLSLSLSISFLVACLFEYKLGRILSREETPPGLTLLSSTPLLHRRWWNCTQENAEFCCSGRGENTNRKKKRKGVEMGKLSSERSVRTQMERAIGIVYV